MTIDELKEKVVNNEIEKGLFTSEDKIVEVFDNGFSIKTLQANGWSRTNIYEYDKSDDIWTESESYNK